MTATANLPLRPEDLLLLAALPAVLGDERRRDERSRHVAELASAGLDWDYVIEASVRHGVAPLLGRALEQAAGEIAARAGDVPAHVRVELRALAERSTSRSRRLFTALGELLGALAAQGIDVVGLKDLQLAVEVYPDSALRPMGDLDLLVRRRDFETVARCLRDLGYVPTATGRYVVTYAYGTSFRRPVDDVWVDVQWNVAQREWDVGGEATFHFDVNRLWERATAMGLDGRRILVPAPEDMLFHLCLHLEGHSYCELVLFADVVGLLASCGESLDWDELLALARGHRSESSVYYVLLIAERLFGVPLPDHVLAELEPSYFHGDLFDPLFGNLAGLHHSLDEIEHAAAPPQEVLDRLELVVRRQAARARRLYAEIDAFASAFLAAVRGPIVFAGSSSPRVLPDPHLPAFDELHAFVSSDELPALRATLRGRGFAADALGRLARHIPITSVEAALVERATFMTVEIEVVNGLESALVAGTARPSSKSEAGRRVLVSRTRRRRADDANAVVRLIVHALSREDLLVAVAARASSQPQRLFALCGLLEVLRRSHTVDRSQMWQRAGHHHVEGGVADALRLAAAVLPGSAPADLLEGPGVLRAAPQKAFSRARLDGDSVRRRAGLRDAFAVLLCLFALRSTSARIRYMLRTLLVPRGGAPVAFRIARSLAADTFDRLLRRGAASEPLSYWNGPISLPARSPSNHTREAA